MKFDFFYGLIALALAALLGYGVYVVAESGNPGHEMPLCIGSSACFFFTLLCAVAIRPENGKISVNQKVLSYVWFIIFLVSCFCFAWLGGSMSFFFILNGILLVVFLALVRTLTSVKDV